MQVDHKTLIRTFVEAINAKDWTRVRSLLAADFTRHSFAAGEPTIRSAEDLIAFLMGEYETFPDGFESILDLVAEGNKVAARHQFSGTQLGPLGRYQPTGRVLEANYLAIYRIEEGLIIEAWAEWDNLTGLRQLGHVVE